DIAPRFGVAYLSDDTPGREMMLRFGVGAFYDMGNGMVDGAFSGAPYSNVRTMSEVTFPLAAANLAAPTLPPTRPYGHIPTGTEGLKAPLIYQANAGIEKNFGAGQTFSLALVETKGTNLMRTETQPSFSNAYSILRVATNGAESTYRGMQVQFRKRMSSA